MRAVYALYPDGDSAQRAVDGLRAAGVPDRDITVVTGEPMEDYRFSEMNRANWLWYIACGGGLLGLCCATWLSWKTQTAWPLQTGNMPLVSWWTNLIVMFELTMLGAIVATVIALFVTGGLLRRRPVLYDPEVTDSHILVGIENPRDASLPDLQRAMLVGPQVRLKTIDSVR